MDQGLRERLDQLARRAGQGWGLQDAPMRLVSYRENAVYQVTLPDGRSAALRLHRPGYIDAGALRSEIDWLVALSRQNAPVPAPIATIRGDPVHSIPDADHGHRNATMLGWVSGRPLGAAYRKLDWKGPRRVELFERLGEGMASLHAASDGWALPGGFQRHAWDRQGLVGDSPFWGRFWESPLLPPARAEALAELRQAFDVLLRESAPSDYGLIHADLVRENVLVAGAGVHFIDFDDAGFGWRLFDIATALLPNLEEPDAGALAAALIRGYRERRSLAEAELDLLPAFLALRALTYVGWFATRPEVDSAAARLERHINRSLDLAARWRAGWHLLENTR